MQDKLRQIRTLLEKRRAREKAGRFVVEGPHLVAEASARLEYVVYAENLPLLKTLTDKGIPCFKISKQQYKELSQVETPQWILAVVKTDSFSLNDLLKGSQPLIVFCLNVQDPGNLGTIIRTAVSILAS